MAEAVVLAVGGFANTAAATAALGTLGFNLAVGAAGLALSVATSAIISALTPVPPSPKQSLLVNARDAAGPQEFVYGETRKGGTITYLETTRGGSVLYQVIVLAAHEIESVEAIYINDEVATLSDDAYDNGDREGAGWVTSPRKWSEDDDSTKHEIRIFYHLGDQTAITDTFANSSVETLDSVFFDTGSSDEDSQNFGGVGQPTKASFVGNGIAYLFVRLGYAADVFQNGIPVITAKIRGKKVFDPRTSTTAYSNNAALCIRDFLASAYGLNDPEIDDTVFQAAANTCDEAVTLDAGGTEARYTINGVVRSDQSYGDVLQEMVKSCAGTLFWGAGKWKLQPGEYNAPTKTFTLDDLRSEISLQTRVNLRDQFNRVQGVFSDANQRYIAADYPPIESAAFLAQDDGVEQTLDLDLPFTTSAATAQRLAKMTLFRGREQMTFSAEFGLNAFDVEVGEIVALTIDRYGWTAKEFEVVGWRFGANQDAGDLRVTLTLRETSEAAFGWTAEESEIIGNDTDLTPTLEAVTNLTATANGAVQNDGTFLNQILVDWDSVAGASGYEVQWMLNTSVDYDAQGGVVTAADVSTAREQLVYDAFVDILLREPGQSGFDYYVSGVGSSLSEAELRSELLASPERQSLAFSGVTVLEPSTQFNISPVLDNQIYFIRVRAYNSLARSPWLTVTYSTLPDVSAPDEPTSLSASASLFTISLEWTNPPDDDLAGIEIWESDDSDINNAALLDTTQGSRYDRNNLAADTRKYYWIRAIDFTGNTSAFVGPVDALTRKLTTADIGDAVIPWDALDVTVENVIDSKISTLETTVGETYATISEVSIIEGDLDTAEGSITDIEAKYGVTIDVNGSITGYQLLNGTGGTAFNVRADQFAVFNSTGAGGDNPFTIFTSPRTVNGVTFPAGTYIQDAYIDRAAIVAASIDTLEIKGEAVTIPLAQTVADGVNDVSGDGTLKEAQWLNITLPQDGNVTIMWDAKHAYSPGFSVSNEQHFIRLTIAPAGTTSFNIAHQVRVKSGLLADDYPTMLYEGSLTGGVTHRVSIWWEGTTDMDLRGRTLVIMGSMR